MYGISLDRQSKVPLVQQLYQRIRTLILSGQLQAGMPLLPSRKLAASLSVGRNVVVDAYEQLRYEGFLQSRQGAFTLVAPNAVFTAPSEPISSHSPTANKLDASFIDFRAGIPALDLFPRKLWQKALNNVLSNSSSLLFGYGDTTGNDVFKRAIADYLLQTRHFVCRPEQLVITAGSTQALALTIKVLLTDNKKILVPDPLNYDIQQYLTALGGQLSPLPLDGQGVQTALLQKHLQSPPAFTFVTPSQPFPTGGILSIQRRIQLIQFARRTDSWLVEDDYESEFSYQGLPLSTLYELSSENVIYIGSFSKTWAPALRLGYMILPPRLLERLTQLTWLAPQQPSSLNQLALAILLNNGQFQAHVKKMNQVYQRRRLHLIQSLHKLFADQITILSKPFGLHLTVAFNAVHFTPPIVETLARAGVRIYPVAHHCFAAKSADLSNQLVFGFGNLSESQITEGLLRLKAVLEATATAP